MPISPWPGGPNTGTGLVAVTGVAVICEDVYSEWGVCLRVHVGVLLMTLVSSCCIFFFYSC